MENIKYFSLFSGIGGFELGIQQAYENLDNRWNTITPALELHRHQSLPNDSNGNGRRTNPSCIGYSEIDKYAIQIYQKHFPNHKNYGDITKINEKELPDFDLLCGGFPCQAFSIAGKRAGFNDTRGTLFFEIARIAKQKQPRYLLLENVKGLLSHDNGRTFRTIIATLDELGYDVQWQVLNSKNHGVPQNRERVYIVGHLRGTPRPEVFPILKSYCEPAGETDEQGCANTLIGRSAGGQNRRGNYIAQVNQPKHSNDRVYDPKGISPTLNTMQGGNRQPFVLAERGRYDKKGKIQQRLEKRHDGVSNTLTSVEKDNRVFDGMKIRRLTPKECERLQGFPDNWTEGISDTQRYKTLGNAVTVNTVRDVVGRLLSPTPPLTT